MIILTVLRSGDYLWYHPVLTNKTKISVEDERVKRKRSQKDGIMLKVR